MSKALLALLLLALIFSAQFVRADDEAADADADDTPTPAAEEEEEEERRTSDAAGVSVRAYFPSNADLKFPAGSYVDTVVGLQNAADNGAFRVEFVVAYLRSAIDTSFYVQNFTGTFYNRTAAAGAVTAVKYRFKPDAQIEPAQYSAVVQVYYVNDDNETFLGTAFNGTVTITDAKFTLDANTIGSYLTFLAIAAGAYHFGKDKLFAGKKGSRSTAAARKASPTSPIELGTDLKGVDLDFVAKDHLRAIARASPKSPKSPKN